VNKASLREVVTIKTISKETYQKHLGVTWRQETFE